MVHDFPQPQRGCVNGGRAGGLNPFRVVKFGGRFPECHYPVGVKESRTLAALRDTLLPKLLSGELRVPAATQLPEGRA
jgi:hypothetical protein